MYKIRMYVFSDKLCVFKKKTVEYCQLKEKLRTCWPDTLMYFK